MKKKTIYLILAAALLVGCLFLILAKAGVVGNKQPKSDIFAVKDTNNITKIFIADMNGEYSLLTRRDDGWYVQDSVKAMTAKVNELLSTIHNVTLQQTVAKTAQSNINKMMSVNAVKVEIYQKVPKFKIFGIPFCSAIPTTIYPPPELSMSFAKAVIEWTIGSGSQSDLYSIRVLSTTRFSISSPTLIGSAIAFPHLSLKVSL